jgi:hypothetical protein
MVLSSSQFHHIRSIYGAVGLFAVIVAWEHVMLLIKYLMQTMISPYSKSVLIQLKREENKSLRERHQHLQFLRTKNDRRSGSYSITPPNISNDNVSYNPKDDTKLHSDLEPISDFGLRQRFSAGKETTKATDVHLPSNLPRKIHSTSSDYKPVNVREVIASPNRQFINQTSAKIKIKPTTTSPVPAPLHQYFENDLTSPLLHDEPSELSLSDMLSVGEDNKVDVDNYKTPMKASMSRARMEQVTATHHKAAERRIEKRLSKDIRKRK